MVHQLHELLRHQHVARHVAHLHNGNNIGKENDRVGPLPENWARS